MKNQIFVTSSIVLVLLALAIPVSADTMNNNNAGGSSYVYVSSVSIDPETFYPYEKGLISVTLTNNGNSSVGVTHPNLLASSNDVSIVNQDKWQTLTYIGSGNSITYSFEVTINGMDGTYFALFTTETKDGQNLHYPLTLPVDSEDLHAAISKKPETFTVDSEEQVNLSLINPRDGAIKSVYITTADSGSDITPSVSFVSSVPANSAVEIPFSITPHKATNITFEISYQNGDVKRNVSVVLPINPGNAKDAAVPTINNLALSSQGSTYDITGDITNTGVSDANGVVVSVGSPAKGTGTYPEYAVGSLASDDSSSFEVTFTSTDISTVPLVIHWKDAYGTDYSSTKVLDLTTYQNSGTLPSGSTTRSSGSGSSSTQGGPGGMSGSPPDGMGGPGGSTSSSSVLSSITDAKGGISSFYPVIAMFAIIIVGGVAYSRRKWIMSKIKKQ